MADEHRGIALQILALLAEVPYPGLTRGEIRNRLGLPPDTEITARIRELRDRASYGRFEVRVEKIAYKVYTYCLPNYERERARDFLAARSAA